MLVTRKVNGRQMPGKRLLKHRDDISVGRTDRVGIDLEETAVVGKETVDFALDIGGLGIDCR